MDFKKFKITTQTIMAYMNCEVDLDIVKKKLKIHYVEDIDNLEDRVHGEIYVDKNKVGKEFRNNISVKVFVMDKYVTMKIVRTGNLHMTGCRSKEHGIQAAVEVLKKLRAIKAVKLDPSDDKYTIIFDVVMANIGFDLDFMIDRAKLDDYIQKYNDSKMYSIFRTEASPSVRVKIQYDDPESTLFDQIVLKDDNSFTRSKVDKCPKAKPHEKRDHTFLVFGGGKKKKVNKADEISNDKTVKYENSTVIQTGRYYDTHMEPVFNSFLQFLNENRDKFEMKITKQKFDINELIGISS